MHHRKVYLAILFLVLVLAACGGQTDTESSVSGTWNGQIAETGEAIVLELTQSDTDVTGTVTVEGSPIAVTGTALGTIVSLSAEGLNGMVKIDANASGSTMQGTIVISLANGQNVSATFTATR